jgi:uncharacterized protein YggE
VLDYLATQGDVVSKVQSTGSQLYPQYEYDQNNGYRRYFKQYTAGATVSFEMAKFKGEVLDGLQAVGGSTIQNIQKKESYEVLVAAQKEAVKNAVFASKLNAANMLAGAGETLGKLLYIDSYTNDYLQPGGGSLQVVRASASGTYEIVG